MGKTIQSYQVLELRVYKTNERWDKRTGTPLEDFIGNARNCISTFEKRAKSLLNNSVHRVFIVMPIQGEEYGSQDEQRVWNEYNQRLSSIELVLNKYNAVAIRIDKEHTLGELVKRIKEEIEKSQFVIADLTDERPSCYFEAGYAEALKKPVVYISSKESVLNPKSEGVKHSV